MGIRPAVVNAHYHRLACALVLDADLSAERQGFMGCRQSVGVERLAIRGALAVKARAVPGGCAGLDWLGLLSRSRGVPEGAAKEKCSDGQGGGSFGHALRFPLFVAMHNTGYCAAIKGRRDHRAS